MLRNETTGLYFNCLVWTVIIALPCISCSTSAPDDKAIMHDWANYCGNFLKDSLKCMNMTINDKKMAGDECEVFITAKAIKTINGIHGEGAVEIKYKLLYKKFDSGWTAIRVESIENM